jgi:hypothetical protein
VKDSTFRVLVMLSTLVTLLTGRARLCRVAHPACRGQHLAQASLQAANF